eukprot:15445476-Alexandrium_andersonii.AAC.1
MARRISPSPPRQGSPSASSMVQRDGAAGGAPAKRRPEPFAGARGNLSETSGRRRAHAGLRSRSCST